MKYKRIGEKSLRALKWKKAYNYAKNFTELKDCYNTWSTAKHNAYTFCISEMCAEGGWGKRIISHNSMHFTFAYQCEVKDGFVLRIITKCNNYEIMWNPF